MSGTVLTEADCHACIPRPVDGENLSPGLPRGQTSAEHCVDVVRMHTTLYCEWYADDAPFTRPWGVAMVCPTYPGRLICGGGI